MNKFIVEYQLPYTHRVQVGVLAEDPDSAIEIASGQFAAGDIWDDTATMPLLFDDYEEDGHAGVSLQFEVVATLASTEDYPSADASVIQVRRDNHARSAAALLLQACSELDTEPGGLKIDRDKLHAAYTAALAACLGAK